MKLCDPRMCWEYRLESWSVRMWSKWRAVVSWCGMLVWKEALKSQPRALLLSVKDRIFCFGPPLVKVSSIVITAAMNSSRLIDNLPRCSIGISYRHAKPSLLYPPKPCSQASERHIVVGSVKVMLLISFPLQLALSRRCFQRRRSSRERSSMVSGPNCFVRCRKCRNRFKKYRPCGNM